MATSLCLNPACPQPQNPSTEEICQSCGLPLRLGHRYRAQAVIGQGGFGRTFRAVDEGVSPPQLCVIKQNLLSQRLSVPQAEVAQRFRQEAERLAELGDHPQIPHLLDYFDLDIGQFLVQAFVPGRNLDQCLAEQGAFEEDQVRRLLGEVLPVLAFIHQRQVIHRDIKPANLIRPDRRDGVDPPIMLVDFGASKYASDPAVLEKTGTVIGSAGYAAPEQALGKAVYASDLYSLGVTCIHLLTGQHPFDLYSVSEDRWVWRPYVQSPVSLKLARILDRMLARGLRERYPSAEAVLAEVRPLLGAGLATDLRRQGGGVRAQPPPIPWTCVQVLNSKGVVNALAISPNGRGLATGGADSTVRLWDAQHGDLIRTFTKRFGLFGQGHQDSVTALAFSPEGRLLLSSSASGQVKGWDLGTYQLRLTLSHPGWTVAVMRLTPDGQTLLTAGGEGKIHIWDLKTRQIRRTLIHHQAPVSGLALLPDGKRLASSSWDATLRLWDLASGRLLQTLTAPKVAVTALVCHPQTGMLVSGDVQGQIYLWQPERSDQGSLLGGHRDRITALAISPNGHWLATGSDDSQIQLWDMRTLTRATTVRHDWSIRALVFAPQGDVLFSSSVDETVRVWRPKEG